jgi:Asp-tRNA(Asn)/Glu-tRNA(Gln) amidotransferase A subunit family amidase
MTVATATELWRMSATDLAAIIRSRQASSREVVEAFLRREELARGAQPTSSLGVRASRRRLM